MSEGRFVLLFLRDAASGGLAPREFADQAGVTRATATGLLDGLERDAWVERRTNAADRRALRRRHSRRAADALSLGTAQSATLVEGLAVDQARLLNAVFPALPAPVRAQAAEVCPRGILQRLHGMGSLLFAALGSAGIDTCRSHAPDTVRGWTCFMVASQPRLDLASRLGAIRPLADDARGRIWLRNSTRPSRYWLPGPRSRPSGCAALPVKHGVRAASGRP